MSHAPIPVDPVAVLGVGIQEAGPEKVGDGSHSHGSTGMARVCLVDGVYRQGTDGVAAFIDDTHNQHAGRSSARPAIVRAGETDGKLCRSRSHAELIVLLCGERHGGWMYTG